LLALYVLLDRNRSSISIPRVSFWAFVLWLLYSLCFLLGGILNLADLITPYQFQLIYYGSQTCILVLSCPFWLILPLQMLREIQNRTYKGNTAPQSQHEMLIKKLKGTQWGREGKWKTPLCCCF
jgi:hypothetical protein